MPRLTKPLALLAVPGGFSAVCMRHETAYGCSASALDLKDFECELCRAERESARAHARFLSFVAQAADAKERALRTMAARVY